jgi:hypothetical protein
VSEPGIARDWFTGRSSLSAGLTPVPSRGRGDGLMYSPAHVRCGTQSWDADQCGPSWSYPRQEVGASALKRTGLGSHQIPELVDDHWGSATGDTVQSGLPRKVVILCCSSMALGQRRLLKRQSTWMPPGPPRSLWARSVVKSGPRAAPCPLTRPSGTDGLAAVRLAASVCWCLAERVPP